MAAVAMKAIFLDEKLSEALRQFPVLYDKSRKYFKDLNKKKTRVAACCGTSWTPIRYVSQ